MASEGSRTAVIAAIVGNLSVAIAKFVVAGITGSSAMLAEGFHSVADTGNQGLLLRGMAVSRKGDSVAHPFGRGKEIYFWSFMVAIMLIVSGSVLAIVEGISAVRLPHPIENPWPNFVVLGVAAAIEGYVFRVAKREFNGGRGSRGLWQSARATKDTMLSIPEVESVGRLLTMHMGPDEILVNEDVDLVDGITDTQVEVTIDRVESAIREVLPQARNIFVELESRRG